MSLLSILCISKFEPHAQLFIEELVVLSARLEAQLVVIADGVEAHIPNAPLGSKVAFTKSKGYLESVHDESVELCDGAYVLRIDDDEMCSPAMVEWLEKKTYLSHDHWKFPRQHLWGGKNSVLLTPQLFPDHQTRLSVKEKAGGRTSVHAGSPFGGGEGAPVCIVHWKFYLKNVLARQRIAANYDAFHSGFGTGGMLAFNVPEEAYRGQEVTLVEGGDGSFPWTPEWMRSVVL